MIILIEERTHHFGEILCDVSDLFLYKRKGFYNEKTENVEENNAHLRGRLQQVS